MCTQRNPFNWSEQLYQKHNEVRIGAGVDAAVGLCVSAKPPTSTAQPTNLPPPPPKKSHHQTISSYLTQTVLPSLRAHHDEFLLQEVKKRWEHHKREC